MTDLKPIHHINRAWRGLVVDGEVVAWPTLMLEHNEALNGPVGHGLKNHTCRWRQWGPGKPVSFDPGATVEDKALVESWLRKIGALA